MMKKVFLLLIFSAIFIAGFSQRISKITISNGSGTTASLTIATNDAIINITPDGNIIQYGIEYFSETIQNYSRIEPYLGRIDNFTSFDDKAYQGKLKYLGQTPVTYYASYEEPEVQGKIKTIGNLTFDYYRSYDDEASRGKIKQIGTSTVTYFTNFDNEALKGKLKSVGITSLNYYSSYDDKAAAGRVKSIGQLSFTYYSYFDTQYRGAMKTGNQQQVVNGIIYFLQ